MERFQAGAHWSCRKESAAECAARAEELFRLLGQCDAVYARWFEFAYSRKNALRLPFEPTAATFQRFFERKKYRLGRDAFYFDAWTGQEQTGKGGLLHLTCGSGTPFYSNGCLLHLPREGAAVARVLSVPVLKQVLLAMVRAWAPDRCAVVPDEDPASKRLVEADGACLGWLTYFSRAYARVPSLPKPARVEAVDELGSLIILTPEPF
ncbi:MAG: Imm52 family immunity protein, partial [Cystobacter sp.]